MGWIWWFKAYEPTTKRWYCRMCDKRTPIELNPQWVMDGQPTQWEGNDQYEWISRCACCHCNHWYPSYACPNCGCDLSEQEPLEMTKPIINDYYSREFGSTGYDWEEKHRCRKCGTHYWITNSTH